MIRVAITTDRFGSVASSFARLGMKPLPTPCIRVVPADEDTLDRARRSAIRAELLLITSVRTLDFLWPSDPMPAVAVAAVGERTATEVRARGGWVVAEGRSGLADLAESYSGLLGSSCVVFPHAAGSIPTALATLREVATDLDEFGVYRTVPIPPPMTSAEAVAFASPTAVEGWLLTRRLEGLVVGVIGPTTSAAVASHRVPEVVAPHPSHHAMAQALASYMEVAV